MAIRGAKPKPNGQARHRNKLVHGWTEVPNVPFAGGPKLPPRRSNGRLWSPRDRQTWKAWSSMPHCVLWEPTDWEFAKTAMEIAAYVHDGDTKLAAELRAWEKVMGTTLDARLSQRIRYVDPPDDNDAALPATVSRLVDYRDL